MLFLNNKYRISDKIDRYNIEYPVPVFDEDGEPLRDEDGIVVHELHTCDIRKKKFKDLQLKFESDTSFKLESVTIEAVVGGYIKR